MASCFNLHMGGRLWMGRCSGLVECAACKAIGDFRVVIERVTSRDYGREREDMCFASGHCGEIGCVMIILHSGTITTLLLISSLHGFCISSFCAIINASSFPNESCIMKLCGKGGKCQAKQLGGGYTMRGGKCFDWCCSSRSSDQ